MQCKLCNHKSITCEIRVIYQGRCVHRDTSTLKAIDWAQDSFKIPCLIRSVYICPKCGFEDLIHEKLFKDKL